MQHIALGRAQIPELLRIRPFAQQQSGPHGLSERPLRFTSSVGETLKRAVVSTAITLGKTDSQRHL
jgi:hypothetical protein